MYAVGRSFAMRFDTLAVHAGAFPFTIDGAHPTAPPLVPASGYWYDSIDDLDRVLLEISHSPSEVSSDQLDDLKQEIENRGLLFKVRVLGSQVRQEESKPVSEKEKRKL